MTATSIHCVALRMCIESPRELSYSIAKSNRCLYLAFLLKMGPKKGGAPKVRVDFSNPANLIQVLQMLNANDTATIKTAEKALKPFTKDPANAAMLISILGSCGDGAVRHHAALLLRKKLGSFYPKYPAAQQTLLKGELIRLVLAEPDSDVATAIAGAIAATASAAFELQQQWPELFALLVQLLAEPEDRLRILTFKILSEVCYSGYICRIVIL
jgi:hypothetical protein